MYLYDPFLTSYTVLIDTWWNVNKIKAKVFEEGKPVLIDTWWNVNFYHPLFPLVLL